MSISSKLDGAPTAAAPASWWIGAPQIQMPLVHACTLLTTSVLLSGAMRMSWTGSASSRGHLVPEPATKEARAVVGFGMNKLLM